MATCAPIRGDPFSLPPSSSLPPGNGGSLFGLTATRLGHVETFDNSSWPSPERFFEAFWKAGKPAVLRGFGARMPAMERWATDADLISRHSSSVIQIELGSSVETRRHRRGRASIKTFAGAYQNTSVYAVFTLDERSGMARDFPLPPLLACVSPELPQIRNVWWSAGGTRSVLHSDSQSNLNCAIAGTKRFFIVSSAHSKIVEDPRCATVWSCGRVVVGCLNSCRCPHLLSLSLTL